MKIYDVGEFYVITRAADWQVRDMLAQDYDYEAPYVRQVSEEEYEIGTAQKANPRTIERNIE